MMADQLRWDFLGCYGAKFLHTPNIDRLADMGVRFTNAYSAHPLCVPARAALVTGMHGLRTGVLTNGQWLRLGGGGTACLLAVFVGVLGSRGEDSVDSASPPVRPPRFP